MLDGSNRDGEGYGLHLHIVTAWEGTPRNLLPEARDQISWFTVEDDCRLPLAHPAYPALFRKLDDLG